MTNNSDGNGWGFLCLPEELTIPEEDETEEVDIFVQKLIEIMSKAITDGRGDNHGKN